MNQFNFDLGDPTETEPTRLSVSGLVAGREVQEIYLVTSKDLRTTKAGKPFLRLKVADRSGNIDCMVWDNAETAVLGFEVGDLVRICGRVTEYEGRPQLEATTIVAAPVGAADPRDFLPSTYRDVDELLDFLRFHIDSVYDRHYSALLHNIFDDEAFIRRFALAPAAKQFHHAYLGGLLEHTVSVAALCESLAQQYPRVNRDLLTTAALLHDVGKVSELTYDRMIDYSDEGKLLGHVLLGVTFVHDKINRIENFPEEKAQMILHAIASHHGELEWGSPKRPKTLEALIIHHIDNLDAKIKGFLEIVEGSRNAQWTDLRNLFRRPLHVPRAHHQEDDFLPPQEEDPNQGRL
ncbi:MAG: CRISPR-associated endonuclease Cas3'' [Actinobacteria bacterium]|nr:CRISPR-associated endonuclease Cas3'' [Actinomycetota bacterium]